MTPAIHRSVRAHCLARLTAAGPLVIAALGLCAIGLGILDVRGLTAGNLLIGSWLAACLIYVVVLTWGLYRAEVPMPARGGPAAPVGLFGEQGELSLPFLRRLHGVSFALPLAAICLVLPLSIHLVVALFFGADPTSFESWITPSVILVGHAHVVLAALAFGHGMRCGHDRSLPRDGEEPLPDFAAPPPSAAQALVLTVTTSSVPGVLFFALPPLLTFLTGLLFVPPLWRWAERRAALERAWLRGG